MLLFGTSLYSQQYLYLQKGNEVPYKRLSLKDPVKIKTAEGDHWISGFLEEITSESINVGGVVYPYKEIVAFRTYSDLMRISGTALAAGGVLLTGIVVVNNLINNEGLTISKGEGIVAASMLGSGLILRWASRKTYKKEDGWKWNVIDLNKDFNQ